jgi:hypothetical protein
VPPYADNRDLERGLVFVRCRVWKSSSLRHQLGILQPSIKEVG